MKHLNKAILIFICFATISVHSQRTKTDLDLDDSLNDTIKELLPKISQDSTNAEVNDHVEAMIEWMTSEHYKSSYVATLIYAETGLKLAEKTGNPDFVYETRTIVGNTMLRVNDTVGAKHLFLKSLAEAKASKDSSAILNSTGNLAHIYYYNSEYKYKTAETYLESIEIAELLKDTLRLFKIHHNLARIYNELDQPENTPYHLEKSETYVTQLGNPPHYLASHLHNQGRHYLLLNQPDKAIGKFEQTIALCENTDFVDALIEGYQGYKEALELKKDYKGVYEVNKKLEVYEENKHKDEAKNITDAVSAKLNVERYKDQIKSKELEKQIFKHNAESKNNQFLLVLGLVVFLVIILLVIYIAYKKRKGLVKDLRAKNKQYLIAKENSEQLTRAKAKFFATVSHELRTPLYGVIGLSSILLENNDLKKHENDLKSLKFSANYLLALINDLLHINKIENNSFTDEAITFNLRDLSSTIISSFEYIRLQHENTIEINIDPNVPVLLKGNSVRLSQILMNLVGNACKFTEKGTISLDVKTLDQSDEKVKLQFMVSDTGPGIEHNKLSEIFTEFSQIDSNLGSKMYQGTGLGLPIVKKLVEQGNGSITVASDIGKGTAFKFDLEISIAPASEEQLSAPIVDFKQLDKKCILIVEDNRINQTVTKKILERANVNCDIAQNGEEAVHMVRKNHYDLVLMDINMPLKNGIEATHEIRTFNDMVPIIALTAVEIEEQKHRIFECGMNDIILKPYDIDLFRQTLVENLVTDKREVLKKLG
ncbi:response regulator [Psychroserpens sp.]|uniref:tetratricopeptide repeat-containing hybrid sensor histidine kinase/response regulator n=1 Tax=Psychroserpens sp. TaxID=2020870 RepID=UPI003C77FDD1